MGQAVQPISSAAMSALIWEIDPDAESVFGASPIGSETPQPETPTGGRLARRLSYLRSKAVPRMIASLNTHEITVILRSDRTDDADNPLKRRKVSSEQDVYAVVSGPSAMSLERGLLAVDDYEVLIAANALTTPLTIKDAVRINGKDHDVVGIKPHPEVPAAVAYRYMVKRAA